MKNKLLTISSIIMLFVPWTILLVRMNEWALKSPAAEIIISCYAVFMIFSGIFTIISYKKVKIQNNIMKICLVINGLYSVGGVTILCMMIATKFM